MRRFLNKAISANAWAPPLLQAKLFFLSLLFFAAVTSAMAGDWREVERADASWREPLAGGFRKRVADAEEKYSGPWREFDAENRGREIYYGFIRGHAIGEFKMGVDRQGKAVDCILLMAYGRDQYALSRPQASRLDFSGTEWEFELKDRGQDYHGKSGSLARGRIHGAGGRLLEGKYTLSLGIHGLISGKIIGMLIKGEGEGGRLPLSIGNEGLFQQLVTQFELADSRR